MLLDMVYIKNAYKNTRLPALSWLIIVKWESYL